MENNFKVLVYQGNFVDINNNGIIYNINTPKLYSKNETIEMIIEVSKFNKDFNGNSFVSKEYLEALQKCELVEYKLVKA